MNVLNSHMLQNLIVVVVIVVVIDRRRFPRIHFTYLFRSSLHSSDYSTSGPISCFRCIVNGCSQLTRLVIVMSLTQHVSHPVCANSWNPTCAQMFTFNKHLLTKATQASRPPTAQCEDNFIVQSRLENSQRRLQTLSFIKKHEVKQTKMHLTFLNTWCISSIMKVQPVI